MPRDGGNQFDDVKPIIREQLRDQFEGDVRLAFYEQGHNLDVHVIPETLESQLNDAIDGIAVSRYSDLKFTITKK